MLFVLIGTTAAMGLKSRQYFADRGIKLIPKYTYVPDSTPVTARFGQRNLISEKEMDSLDFHYTVGDMIVGFRKSELMDAVSGVSSYLLTVSGDNLDFVEQIKSAYGGYVTVIGVYIDRNTLRSTFKTLPGITEEEMTCRMNVGTNLQKFLLKKRDLYDEIVIYGGEDSIFGESSLLTQYDSIIRKALQNEKQLNNRAYESLPYSGRDPYVFVSYSHGDLDQVYPLLAMLQRSGFRVWYDEGIQGGENWRKILCSKIQSPKCKNFILFSSANAAGSRHVQAEIIAALHCEKKILTVRMDCAEFSLDYEMYLQTYQSLYASDSGFPASLVNSIDPSTRIS